MPQAAPILGNIAINLAIGAGTSLLAYMLQPPQKKPKDRPSSNKGVSFEVAFGESVPLFTILGRGRTGGHLIFAQPYGSNNNYLKLVYVCGKGHYDGFESLIVDEDAVTLAGSNDDPHGRSVVEKTVSGTPYMWVKTYDGAPGQVADPELVAAANPSDRWTANHTLTGTPYAIITLRWNDDLYGGVLPNFGFVWRGLKLYDWREDSSVDGGSGAQRWSDQTTWEWTENPAVIAYNWRRGYAINGVKVFGLGFPATANDIPYFTSCANICDESISYPETSATLARYAYGRQVTDAEDRLDVLRELEGAWCGASFSRGGAYAPVPAATTAPIMVLEDSHRRGGYPVRADKWGKVSDKRTAWHGQFVSQADGWIETPYGTRTNSSLETLIGGRRSIQFDQPFEYKVERAQMRAEIALRRQAFSATRTETFGPRAIVLEPGDCITRRCDWGDVVMIVDEVQRLAGNLGATLTLSEWSNSIVPASDESFVTLPPSIGTQPGTPDRTLTIPSPFTVVPYDIVGENGTLPGARATWPQITDPNVTEVLIRVWPTAGSEVNDGIDVQASARLQTSKIFGPLQDATQFSYHGTVIRNDGRTTTWTGTGTFTTGSISTPASVPPIEVSMLGDELAAAHGLLTSTEPGSVQSELALLQDRAEEAALSLLDLLATTRESIEILQVQKDGAVAGVIQTQTAIVTERSARAQAITEVVASLDQVLADGYLSIEASVDELASKATISMGARATSAATAEAKLLIKAEADGLGGTLAQIGVLGDFYVFESVDGDPIRVFSVADGVVKVDRIESIAVNEDLTPRIVIDGVTGYFSITID